MEMFLKGKFDFVFIFLVILYRSFGENMFIKVCSYFIVDNFDYVLGYVICFNMF